jgi:hypothetical protein
MFHRNQRKASAQDSPYQVFDPAGPEGIPFAGELIHFWDFDRPLNITPDDARVLVRIFQNVYPRIRHRHREQRPLIGMLGDKAAKPIDVGYFEKREGYEDSSESANLPRPIKDIPGQALKGHFGRAVAFGEPQPRRI